MTKPKTLAESIRNGDRLALARLITDIENNAGNFQEPLDALYPHTGDAHIIGVTGPSGSGKSTLVKCLVNALLKEGSEPLQNIAVIAVDPTSPFTGGALLGDRVRMQSLAADPRVFIRSMATRGSLGGIARAVDNAVIAMDAAGFNPIIIETVGAGQSEVEITKLAHTTIVVDVPGLGDDIQASKAGLLEIADILVLNKSDKAGADASAATLKHMLELGRELQGQTIGVQWNVPLVKTSALHGEGIDDLVNAIHAQYTHLQTSGAWEKCDLQRLGKQINDILRDTLFGRWQEDLDQEKYNDLMVKVLHHQISPNQAVQKLLKS